MRCAKGLRVRRLKKTQAYRCGTSRLSESWDIASKARPWPAGCRCPQSGRRGHRGPRTWCRSPLRIAYLRSKLIAPSWRTEICGLSVSGLGRSPKPRLPCHHRPPHRDGSRPPRSLCEPLFSPSLCGQSVFATRGPLNETEARSTKPAGGSGYGSTDFRRGPHPLREGSAQPGVVPTAAARCGLTFRPR